MKRIIILTGALVLLLTVVSSVALGAAAPPGAPAAAQAAVTLEGPRWVLVSFADQNGKTVQALPNVESTAQFANGRVTGSGGCNNFTASYTAAGSKLTISQAASTMMACEPQSIMEQEAAYLANLQAAASYAITGDILTVANVKGDTVLTFKASQPISLTSGTWVMTSYNNGKQAVVSGLQGTEVTAVFDPAGTLSGSGGCNNYHGSYKADGNKIQIGELATTRMMCAEPIMAQEQAYLAAIKQAATYDVNGTFLQLRSAGDALLAMYSYRAASQPAGQATPAPAKPAIAGVLAGQDLKNTYVTLLPSADRGPRTITLRLDPGGKAELATRVEQDAPLVQTGVWKDSGPDTVAVTLTEQSGVKMARPTAIAFKRDGTNLIATEYDKNLFGQEGLKLNQAADVARRVQTGLATLDLAAGFPLDPTFVSVNGGGQVDARLLGQQGCQGYINTNPAATVHWTGAADMVRTFFYSDNDATLVVMTPKGEILCSANANEGLLSPVVDVSNPVTGTYRIWVGSTAKNQLVPGILVLTAKPNVNVDTFDLTKLVKRPIMPKAAARPAPGVAAAKVQQMIQDAGKSAPAFKPGTALTATITAAGDIPLFQFPLTKTCAGLVSPQPSFVFTATAPIKQLRVFFEGDGDASLLVFGNGGRTAECNDDAETGKNANPVVDLANLPAGGYAVYVGRLSPAQPVKGMLTVTDAADAKPTVLAPKAK